MDRTFLTTLTIVLLTESVSAVIITGPDDVLIEDKSVANLTCLGDNSDLNLTTEWRKDGLSLTPNDRIQFSPDNTSVLIRPVSRTDSGVYTCTLSDNSTSNSAAYSLTVSYGPDMMILGAAHLEDGSDILFYCFADSYPVVSITWSVDGKILMHPELLVIPNSNSSNSGKYDCTAFNNDTGITASAQHFLTITGKLSGLSAGAAAGITVGVILGLEVLAVLLYFLIIHLKKSGSICKIPKPRKDTPNRPTSSSSTMQETKFKTDPRSGRDTQPRYQSETERPPAPPGRLQPHITRKNKPKEEYEDIYENVEPEDHVYEQTLPGRRR